MKRIAPSHRIRLPARRAESGIPGAPAFGALGWQSVEAG
jgi:hypothetical protein